MAFVTPVPLARRATLPSNRTSLLPTHSRPTIGRVRMIATEPATATPLSTRARELVGYIRGHKSIFRPGVGFSSTSATLFRKNDTGRTLTPLEELATSANMLPGGSVAAMILVKEEDLLQKALEAAIAVDATIEQDETRKEIIQYDIKYLLRVVSYAAAAQSVDFVHEDNLTNMRELHDEVGLARAAGVAALEKMKEEVVGQTESGLVEGTAACFDVVIKFMS